jgi:DNA-binding PadR family transcriptional regulator
MGDRVLAPGEWAVLALLCERPAHGWALAAQLTSSGELGAVWTMGRPLVYRSLEILEQRQLIEDAGHERGARGPSRTIFRPTPHGREALESWLYEPVEHVREVRSLLLLKLVFARRLDVDPQPLLRAQSGAVLLAVRSLEKRAERAGGSEQILLRFRLESTRGVARFIDGLLADGEPVSALAV